MDNECNVGGVDRIVRLAVGSGLIGAGLFIPMNKWLAVVLETVGITAAATGVAQYCPISKALGRNTCEVVREEVVETPASLQAVR